MRDMVFLFAFFFTRFTVWKEPRAFVFKCGEDIFIFQTDKMHIYEYVVEYVMHASTNNVHTPLMFTSFSMHLHL